MPLPETTPTMPSETQPAPTGTHANSRLRGALEWIVVIVGAVIVALVIKTFLIQAFFIPTASMEPTLVGEQRSDGTQGEGDRILVDKVSYRFRDVSRGDVIVFENPDADQFDTVSGGSVGTAPPADLVKRVIGLPGDTVVFVDGAVTVNGEPLDEPYLPDGTVTTPAGGTSTWPHTCTAGDPCTVPDDMVWVMGDNRDNSRDSRYMGPIAQDAIVGRAFVTVWPLDRLGGL